MRDNLGREEMMNECLNNDCGKKVRIGWLDLAKGIAILLVILGHLDMCPVVIRAGIYSFHMPLFIIINGYFIFSYSVKKTLVKSTRSLLAPYIVVCSFQLLFDVLNSVSVNGDWVNSFVLRIQAIFFGMSKSSTILTNVPSVWLMWFVCMLFLARNLYVFLMNCFVKRRWIADIILIGLMCLGYFIGNNVAYLPWSFDVVLTSMIFLRVGDYLRKSQIVEKYPAKIFIASAGIWGICLYLQLYIDLSMRRYQMFPITHLEAIAGSLCVLIFCKYLARVFYIQNVLGWYGKHSMLILGIHCLEMMYFDWEQYIFIPLGISSLWVVQYFIKVVVISLVALVLHLLFSKIKSMKLHVNKSL